MRYFLIFLILFSHSFGDNLAAKLESLIQNKQVKKVVILKYNPFFVKKETKKLQKNEKTTIKRSQIEALSLVTIIDNKAFINGKWLGESDFIDGYKIKKIYANKVVLLKKNKKTVLRFEKSRDILKVRKNKHEN